MIILLGSFEVFLFASAALGQVADYETTPSPTSFTCHGRAAGYYADTETGCKTYHLCDGNSHFMYMCPKRTLFQQKTGNCDHSYRVNCEESSDLFEEENDHLDIETDLHLTSYKSQPSAEILQIIQNQTEELIPSREIDLASEKAIDVTPTLLSTSFSTAETFVETPTTESIQNLSVESSIVNRHSVLRENYASQSLKEFLLVRLMDFRSLFYIPNFDNNALKPELEREFVLPIKKSNPLRFKTRNKNSSLPSPCPTYCDPKYFFPGTCHPCLLIK